MEQRLKHKKKIMVVDDLREVTGLLKVFLSREYEVTIAHDGAQALNLIFDGYAPDAILTDLNMPGVDGYRFIRELQSNTDYRRIPVIVISVVDRKRAEQKLAEQLVAAFVAKTSMRGNVFKQLGPILKEVTASSYISGRIDHIARN